MKVERETLIKEMEYQLKDMAERYKILIKEGKISRDECKNHYLNMQAILIMLKIDCKDYYSLEIKKK